MRGVRVMLCEVCGERQATVHYTEIINDQVTTLHLCEECAQQKGMSDSLFKQFSLAGLLSALLDAETSVREEETATERCSACGLSYKDFKRLGYLGCSSCYGTFSKNLVPLLRRIHGSTQHVGKVPTKLQGLSGLRREVRELRTKLQKAINLENYEEAARLRDQIKKLEKEIGIK